MHQLTRLIISTEKNRQVLGGARKITMSIPERHTVCDFNVNWEKRKNSKILLKLSSRKKTNRNDETNRNPQSN